MSRVGFSLIEILIIVFIMGILYSLVSFSKIYIKPVYLEDFKNAFYPNGEVMLKDGKLKVEPKKKVVLGDVKQYFYDLKTQNFYEGKGFYYIQKNGLQNSFIACDMEFCYVFLPFEIVKVRGFSRAKEIFLNREYLPKEGEYY